MKPLKLVLPVILALLSTPVTAAEYTYSPKDCEFRLTYPEKPSEAKACNPEQPLQCHDASTFTKIYAMDTSIRITTTCNPAEAGMLERYSGEVMKYTLETMAKNNVDDFQSGFNDHGDTKQAILLGNKKMPDGSERIYMAQLWIGKKSVFTIEGEVMSGPESTQADLVFGNIFKSIRPEGWDAGKEAAKSEKDEGKSED